MDPLLQAARELVAAWGFLHTFSELLGVWPASLTELLAGLVVGASSRLTAELHIGLLRLLQVPGKLVH
jgi:DDT domain